MAEQPMSEAEAIVEHIPQCDEILDNTRQQCTRPAYATIGNRPFCRLHFSFRMNRVEDFNQEHKVCDKLDQPNLNQLLGFFKAVHDNTDKKEDKKEQKKAG